MTGARALLCATLAFRVCDCLGKEPIVSVLELRTRIVQLAIAMVAMVALAAMTFGAVSVQANITAPPATAAHLHLATTTGGLLGYDGDNDNGTECDSDNPATPGTDLAIPAGNGAFGAVLYCTDGSVKSAILMPAAGLNGVVAVNGATSIVTVVLGP